MLSTFVLSTEVILLLLLTRSLLRFCYTLMLLFWLARASCMDISLLLPSLLERAFALSKSRTLNFCFALREFMSLTERKCAVVFTLLMPPTRGLRDVRRSSLLQTS